jgi:hypothetical protein
MRDGNSVAYTLKCHEDVSKLVIAVVNMLMAHRWVFNLTWKEQFGNKYITSHAVNDKLYLFVVKYTPWESRSLHK